MPAQDAALFYPPKLNPFWVKIAQWLVRPVCHWIHKFSLVISEDSLVRLRSLLDQRLLLLPNHPTFHDPWALFALSTYAGRPFYYLSALEPFAGATGPWMQRLGGYSIRRGMADRASISQTIELLTQPDCKLVIFAEGGCSFQNDTVMPFETGAIQMAFQALKRLEKQSSECPDLYAVPISLKYRYQQDMTAIIEHTLQGLEQALELKTVGEPYQRLRVVTERRLQDWECWLRLQPKAEQTQEQRMAIVKIQILELCEQILGLLPGIRDSNRDRVYRIQERLNAASKNQTLPSLADTPWTWDFLSNAVIQVLNYDAVYDGYITANPTAERILDTLVRLERDVFKVDQPKPKAFRRLYLYVAEPINLKDWFADYQRDRSDTIKHVTEKLHQIVQSHVDHL
jgi:1-acyl-sn-glycerol-3-phosphate acyltransferase